MESALPYFHRFIEALPTLQDLAVVEEDRLLKLWEGLGYYSRARNLKKGAQYICEELGGILPRDPRELQKIPGIGPYSAGAIASTLYQVAAPAIDGNVLRVFSRLYRLEEDLKSASLRKRVQEKLIGLIPTESPGDFNQALMELGALVCTPTSPHCSDCPLSSFCESAGREDATSFPRKTKKAKVAKEFYTVLLLECAGSVALSKKEDSLLAGLYSFPMQEGHLSLEELQTLFEEKGCLPASIDKLGTSSHLFSHRKWEMLFYRVQLCAPDSRYSWQEKKRLGEIPIASAFRFLKEVLDL